jgi:hypothetical protein
MLPTNFEACGRHLNDYLGIELTRHLRFTNAGTLTDFSVVGSLIVVYRYAEALRRRLVVHDMSTGGHKSHLLGTELDFDMDGRRRNPIEQVHVISDMLRIRRALRPFLNAFRLGLYVDYFSNTDASSWEKYQKMYRGKSASSSMHIGVRYKWTQKVYQGHPLPSSAGAFTLWGRGSTGYGNSGLWTQRIRSWPIGFLGGQCEALALRTIATDFCALDYNLPPLAYVIAATAVRR